MSRSSLVREYCPGPQRQSWRVLEERCHWQETRLHSAILDQEVWIPRARQIFGA